MSTVGLEILVVLLLALLNGVFATAEIAVVSSRPERLQQRVNAGRLGATTALRLVQHPGRFLATIQIGITLVGIVAGAFGGATLAGSFRPVLDGAPLVGPYSSELSFGIVVGGIAFLTLVIGELVPKRIALRNPEGIASTLALPMRTLSAAALPAVWFLNAATDLVLRLLFIRPTAAPPVSEEEIRVLMRQGAEAGVFEEEERAMVGRVFRLADLRVSALMTPRTEAVWLELHASAEEVRRTVREEPHSAFPVTEDGLDNVVGVVRARDLLARSMADLSGEEALDLRAVMQPAVFVPESTSTLVVLETLKHSGAPMALVVDEYGGIEGLVTLHDFLEGIVGDIPTVGYAEEPSAVQREDGSWLLDGQLLISEVNDLLGEDVIPMERAATFNTVAGFVIGELGRIPRPGEHFTWKDRRFEVVDMDGNRVDKVLVAKESDGARGGTS